MQSNRAKKILMMSPLVVLLMILPQLITAFSGGPLDGKTGAPGEGSCMDCHLNSSGGNGSLNLSGVPQNYELNQAYTLTVTIEDPGQKRWGFEATASDDNNNGAGAFNVTDAVNTQLSDNASPSKDYMKHTSTGTFNNTLDGPVSWDFDWQAPASDIGTVTFYVASNAANGNFNNTGDFIYFTSESSAAPLITCQGTCGNANNDGSVNVSDAVYIINYVFVGGAAPQPVLACGNANNDGSVNVSDAVYVINYVFVGGNPPGDCNPGVWDNDGGDCCVFIL